MSDMALEFSLLARDNASRAFRNVGDEAERTGKRASDGMRSMGTAAAAAGAALAGAGLVKGFVELYQAADESRKIAARTENVIAQMGNAANVSAKQVGDLAGAIAAKTGVDDEAIQSGQNLLLTFGNIKDVAGEGNDVFSQTSQLMVDMSAAMGTDASSSAIQLGKALNDPVKGITALSKAGVSFTEDQKAMIRSLVEAGDTLGAQKIILGELEKQFGGAAEAMATPMDKLKVSAGNLVEELGGYLLPVVDEVATSLNEGLMPSASDLGPKLAGLATAAADLVPQFIDMAEQGLDLGIAVLPMLTGSLGVMLDIADRLGPALPYVVAGIAAMKVASTVGPGIEGLAGSMGRADGKLAGFGRGLGAASIALPLVGAGVGVFVDAIHESEDALTANTTLVSGWITGMNEGGAAAAQVAADMERNRQIFQDVFNVDITETDEWAQALDKASEASRRHWESLNPLEQATQKVTEWTNNLSYALEENGAGSDEAGAAQERLAYWTDIQTGRQGALDGAVQAATGTTSTFTQGLEDAATAASEASRETNMLKTALDVLTGASVSMIEVESAYQDSLTRAAGALKDLNGTVLDGAGGLNLQSEAGRAAGDVLLGVRDSGNQLIATMVQQGRSSEEVRAKDAELRESFIRSAEQMGISRGAAENLANQILGIPAERETKILADTVAAENAVRNLQTQIDGLRGRTVDIIARATMPDLNGSVSGNGRPGLAFGGPVPGFSPGDRSDNVPIWATAGEFMQSRPAVRKYGMSFMEAVNEGRFPAEVAANYAFGGPIGITAHLDASAYNSQMDGLAKQVLDRATALAAAAAGPLGGGAVGGGWQSIWNHVKAAIPQARQNSTFRPGDSGYHGRGKAIDFGFGSGPGGAGSAGLASINRYLHDTIGGNLAELIYDGLGDDRPDLKNGRPLTYNAGTRAEHRNHVHAAVYESGTNYVPQTGYAVVHRGEAIVPASENQGDPFSRGPVEITGTLVIGGDGLARIVDGRILEHKSASERNDRSWA